MNAQDDPPEVEPWALTLIGSLLAGAATTLALLRLYAALALAALLLGFTKLSTEEAAGFTGHGRYTRSDSQTVPLSLFVVSSAGWFTLGARRILRKRT
jgi:hypothetical protein